MDAGTLLFFRDMDSLPLYETEKNSFKSVQCGIKVRKARFPFYNKHVIRLRIVYAGAEKKDCPDHYIVVPSAWSIRQNLPGIDIAAGALPKPLDTSPAGFPAG